MNANTHIWWIVVLMLLGSLSAYSQSLSLTGPLNVCLNQNYPYQVAGDLPENPIFLWQVDGGESTGSQSQIQAEFFENNATVSVTVIGEDFNESVSLSVTAESINYDITFPQCGGETSKVDLSICVGTSSDIEVFSDAQNTVSWSTPPEISIPSSGSSVSASSNTIGNYLLTMTITSPSGCTVSEEIPVSVQNPPSLSLSSAPEASDGTISICEGQSVFFTSDTDGSFVRWDFGDGNEANGFSAGNTFTTAGTYTVTATSFLNCCSSLETLQVIVGGGSSVNVECAGPVCAGETASYCATGECASYDWSVDGGSIVSGAGTDCVDILWAEPESGIGVINISGNDCNVDCSSEGVITVPIISASEISTTTSIACIGTNVYISFNNAFGFSFDYTVAPASFSEIFSNDNGAFLNFSEAGVYTVTASGSNALFGCDVESSLELTILGEASVMVEEACSSDDIMASVSPAPATGSAANYELLLNNAIVASGIVSSGSFTIPGGFAGGSYVLKLIPNVDEPTFCETEIAIEIGSTAEITGITGEQIVCPDQLYTYVGEISDPSNEIHWSISGGQFSGGGTSYIGQTPSVIWFGNGELTATAVSPDSECSSLPFSIEVMLFDTLNMGIVGNEEVCNSSTSAYSLDPTTDQVVTWSLNSSVGSIVSGQFSSEIEIAWNFLNTPETLILSAIILDCEGMSVTISKTITVTPTPIPDAIGPSLVCPGELFDIDLVGIGNASSITAVFDSGEIIVGSGTSISINLSSPQLIVVNTPGIHYVAITVTNPDDCVGEATTLFNFEVSDEPAIALSSLDPTCQPCDDGLSAELFLSSQLGQIDFSTYEITWFFIEGGTGSSVAVASGVTSYIASGPSALGIYFVEVINTISGCRSVSNNLAFQCGEGLGQPIGEAYIDITLVEQGSDGPGVVNVSGNVINGLPVETNPLEGGCSFEFGGDGLSGGSGEGFKEFQSSIADGDCLYYYLITDPISGNQSFSTDPSFTTQFEVPGYYPIEVYVACSNDGEVLWSYYQTEIIIPYIPSFEYSVECSQENGQYTVNFFNTSLYLDGIVGISDMWILDGDMAFPGSDDLSVTLWPGEHCMLFQIMAPGFPSYYYEECFTLEEIPSALISVAPQSGCENTVFDFAVNYSGDVISPIWDFGDGTQSILPNPQKTFSLSGNVAETFTVSLSFTNIFGCRFSEEIEITVSPSDLSGGIEVNDPICSLDPLLLSFIPDVGDPSDYTYAWNTGETTSSIEAMSSGTYYVYVFDGDCAVYASTQVVVGGSPALVVSHPDQICQNDGITFTSASIEGASYAWTVGNTSSTQQSPYVYFGSNQYDPGPVDVELTITYGDCSYMYTGQINILEGPERPNITSEISGDCENFSATLSTGDDNTVWSTGETGASINVSEYGSYTAYVISGNGCASQSDFMNLNEPNLPNSWVSGCVDACIEDIEANPISISVGFNTTVYFNGEELPISGNQIIIDGAEDAGVYYIERCRTIGEGESAIECCVSSDPFELNIDSCEDCEDIEVLPEGIECVITDDGIGYDFTVCLMNAGLSGVNSFSIGGGTIVDYELIVTGTFYVHKGIFIPDNPLETEMCWQWDVEREGGGNCIIEHCRTLPVCFEFCPVELDINVECAGYFLAGSGTVSMDPGCVSQEVNFSILVPGVLSDPLEGTLNEDNGYSVSFSDYFFQSNSSEICFEINASVPPIPNQEGSNWTGLLCEEIPECDPCDPYLSLDWECKEENQANLIITSYVSEACEGAFELHISPLNFDFMYISSNGSYDPAIIPYNYGYAQADAYYIFNNPGEMLFWFVSVVDADGNILYTEYMEIPYPCGSEEEFDGKGKDKRKSIQTDLVIEAASFTLSPNPSSTVISISGNLNQIKQLQGLIIQDVSGRIVLTSERLQNIDISSLPSGNYLVRLKNLNGVVNETLRLVVI